MQSIIINGIPAEHLPILDRGFQYGDGLFETIACERGALQFWDEHIIRMKNGAKALNITFPGEGKYLQDIKDILKTGLDEKCVIKLMLTRGQGDRGYQQPRSPKPTRAVIVNHWPAYPSEISNQGIKVYLCKHPVSINPSLAGIKHLNRLDNILARSEWNNEYHEGFMFDTNGNLIEGTMSNVFCIKNNTLLTPNLDRGGVNGIVREQVLLIARDKNLAHQAGNITANDLYAMDEIFITNSIIGLWPVNRVAETSYPIGNMTRLIETELRQRIKTNEKTFS